MNSALALPAPITISASAQPRSCEGWPTAAIAQLCRSVAWARPGMLSGLRSGARFPMQSGQLSGLLRALLLAGALAPVPATQGAADPPTGLEACKITLSRQASAVFVTASISGGPGTAGIWQIVTRQQTGTNTALSLQSGQFEIPMHARTVTLSPTVLRAAENLILISKMSAQDHERKIECHARTS